MTGSIHRFDAGSPLPSVIKAILDNESAQSYECRFIGEWGVVLFGQTLFVWRYAGMIDYEPDECCYQLEFPPTDLWYDVQLVHVANAIQSLNTDAGRVLAPAWNAGLSSALSRPIVVAMRPDGSGCVWENMTFCGDGAKPTLVSCPSFAAGEELIAVERIDVDTYLVCTSACNFGLFSRAYKGAGDAWTWKKLLKTSGPRAALGELVSRWIPPLLSADQTVPSEANSTWRLLTDVSVDRLNAWTLYCVQQDSSINVHQYDASDGRASFMTSVNPLNNIHQLMAKEVDSHAFKAHDIRLTPIGVDIARRSYNGERTSHLFLVVQMNYCGPVCFDERTRHFLVEFNVDTKYCRASLIDYRITAASKNVSFSFFIVSNTHGLLVSSNDVYEILLDTSAEMIQVDGGSQHTELALGGIRCSGKHSEMVLILQQASGISVLQPPHGERPTAFFFPMLKQNVSVNTNTCLQYAEEHYQAGEKAMDGGGHSPFRAYRQHCFLTASFLSYRGGDTARAGDIIRSELLNKMSVDDLIAYLVAICDDVPWNLAHFRRARTALQSGDAEHGQGDRNWQQRAVAASTLLAEHPSRILMSVFDGNLLESNDRSAAEYVYLKMSVLDRFARYLESSTLPEALARNETNPKAAFVRLKVRLFNLLASCHAMYDLAQLLSQICEGESEENDMDIDEELARVVEGNGRPNLERVNRDDIVVQKSAFSYVLQFALKANEADIGVLRNCVPGEDLLTTFVSRANDILVDYLRICTNVLCEHNTAGLRQEYGSVHIREIVALAMPFFVKVVFMSVTQYGHVMQEDRYLPLTSGDFNMNLEDVNCLCDEAVSTKKGHVLAWCLPHDFMIDFFNCLKQVDEDLTELIFDEPSVGDILKEIYHSRMVLSAFFGGMLDSDSNRTIFSRRWMERRMFLLTSVVLATFVGEGNKTSYAKEVVAFIEDISTRPGMEEIAFVMPHWSPLPFKIANRLKERNDEDCALDYLTNYGYFLLKRQRYKRFMEVSRFEPAVWDGHLRMAENEKELVAAASLMLRRCNQLPSVDVAQMCVTAAFGANDPNAKQPLCHRRRRYLLSCAKNLMYTDGAVTRDDDDSQRNDWRVVDLLRDIDSELTLISLFLALPKSCVIDYLDRIPGRWEQLEGGELENESICCPLMAFQLCDAIFSSGPEFSILLQQNDDVIKDVVALLYRYAVWPDAGERSRALAMFWSHVLATQIVMTVKGGASVNAADTSGVLRTALLLAWTCRRDQCVDGGTWRSVLETDLFGLEQEAAELVWRLVGDPNENEVAWKADAAERLNDFAQIAEKPAPELL